MDQISFKNNEITPSNDMLVSGNIFSGASMNSHSFFLLQKNFDDLMS